MRWIFLVLATICLVGGLAWMAYAVKLIESDNITQLPSLAPCPTGQTLVQESLSVGGRSASNPYPGIAYYWFCETASGEQINVSDVVMRTVLTPFLVLVVISVFLFVIMAMMFHHARQQRIRTQLHSFGLGSTGMGKQQVYHISGGEMSDDMRAKLNNALGGVNVVTSGQPADLSSRLQQLETAMRQGLISKSEYEKARQSILNRMGDA